jgi:hypothetical protein
MRKETIMGDIIPFTGPPPLNLLNHSELLELVYIHRGIRLRRDTSPERLIRLLENPQEQPHPQEVPTTTETRARLEQWIMKNWAALQSQLPCKAHNRGRCTIYPCSEIRHLSCWLLNKEKFL